MIDQSTLYADCPCGSGKKFKFCCYPSIRGELPRDPTDEDIAEAIRIRSKFTSLTTSNDPPGGDSRQMTITEDAPTCASLDPANERRYSMAIEIALNPSCRKSELKAALRMLEDLHEKAPDHPGVSNNLASVLARLGRSLEASSLIRECFEKHPEYVFGAANYLSVLVQSGQMDEAETLVKSYRLPQRVHPDACLAWLRAARMYYEECGADEQVLDLEKSMDFVVKSFKSGRK